MFVRVCVCQKKKAVVNHDETLIRPNSRIRKVYFSLFLLKNIAVILCIIYHISTTYSHRVSVFHECQFGSATFSSKHAQEIGEIYVENITPTLKRHNLPSLSFYPLLLPPRTQSRCRREIIRGEERLCAASTVSSTTGRPPLLTLIISSAALDDQLIMA